MEFTGLPGFCNHVSSFSKPGPATSKLILAAAFASVFLLTALIGVWAAYDRSRAWQAFALIALGIGMAFAIVWAGHRGGEQAVGIMSLAMALLAGGIGVYFLLIYDWSAGAGKVALLQQIGLAVQVQRPVIALPEDINANVAANGLTLTLFLGLGGLFWALERRLWAGLVVAGLAWLAGLTALVLTMSRGAWLSIGAGLMAMAYLVLRRRFADRREVCVVLDLLALATIVSLAVFFWAAVRSPNIAQVLGTTPAGASAIGRATLWRDGLDLVGDYLFTGSGLRSTMMVYSTYGLLLHVGFITHMHNLFLQIAVEQGVVAFLAFVGLLAVAAASVLAATRPGRPGWRFGLTAGAALAALAVHGMVDVGVYASLMTPVLFLPLGFALALDPGEDQARVGSIDWSLTAALALAGAFALVVFLPSGRAALQVNLGAVAQTRAELSVYTWPAWSIQDELRRSPAIDLGPAITRYQAALDRDPRNDAANRRLGQIELSRGQYDVARAHLEAAYAAAPRHRATRQMLAESYAIAGEVERAAELMRTVDTSAGQIDARVFWYERIGEPERAEWLRQAEGEAEREYHNE